MNTFPNCVPQDTYLPDSIVDMSKSWEQSDEACPKCGSKDFWEVRVPDESEEGYKIVFECDECNAHIEE